MKHMYGMCALALFATATLFVGTQANFAQADEESNSATKVTFSVPGMK